MDMDLVETRPCPMNPVDTRTYRGGVWLGQDLVTRSRFRSASSPPTFLPELVVKKTKLGGGGPCVLLFFKRQRVTLAVRVNTVVI